MQDHFLCHSVSCMYMITIYILNFIWPVFQQPCPSVAGAVVVTCQSPAVSFFHPLLAFSGTIQMKKWMKKMTHKNKTSRLRIFFYLSQNYLFSFFFEVIFSAKTSNVTSKEVLFLINIQIGMRQYTFFNFPFAHSKIAYFKQ